MAAEFDKENANSVRKSKVQKRAIRTLLVDANALIKNGGNVVERIVRKQEKLFEEEKRRAVGEGRNGPVGFSIDVVTLPDIICEVRDETSKKLLNLLELKLGKNIEQREPAEDCVKAVINFARGTGDLPSLSSPDIRLIALALSEERFERGEQFEMPKPPAVGALRPSVVLDNRAADAAVGGGTKKKGRRGRGRGKKGGEKAKEGGEKEGLAVSSLPGWGEDEGDEEEWKGIEEVNDVGRRERDGETQVESVRAEERGREDPETVASNSEADKSESELKARERGEKKGGEVLLLAGGREGEEENEGEGSLRERELKEKGGEEELGATRMEEKKEGEEKRKVERVEKERVKEEVVGTRGKNEDVRDEAGGVRERVGGEVGGGEVEGEWEKAISRSTRRKKLLRKYRNVGNQAQTSKNPNETSGETNRGGSSLGDFQEKKTEEETGVPAVSVSDNALKPTAPDEIVESSFHSKLNSKCGFEAEVSSVAVVTSDFAMQNVILQMGLHLLSVDGVRVTRLQRWFFRCSACFTVSPDLTKQFCPGCGNGETLLRTSFVFDANRDALVQMGVKKRFNIRGTKFSLPLPKGGREGADKNAILREDQKLPHALTIAVKRSRRSRRVQNKGKEEDLAFNSDAFWQGGTMTSGSANILIQSQCGEAVKLPILRPLGAKRNPNERKAGANA